MGKIEESFGMDEVQVGGILLMSRGLCGMVGTIESGCHLETRL